MIKWLCKQRTLATGRKWTKDDAIDGKRGVKDALMIGLDLLHLVFRRFVCSEKRVAQRVVSTRLLILGFGAEH